MADKSREESGETDVTVRLPRADFAGISFGKSVNIPPASMGPLPRHIRTRSEPASSTFVSKLPPAVINVSKEDIRSYMHIKRVTNYLVGSTLGEGSFAKVKEALHHQVGEKVAMKVIDKRKAAQDPYMAKNFRREAKLLKMVKHPNIIQLYEVIETPNSYYLITELCSGGELMKYIYKRGHLSEQETQRFIRQIVSAVDHLHKAGIIHRDLKVENLMLDSNMDIKLIDFGLSNEEYIEGDDGKSHCSTQCGSPAYAAPELLGHKEYGSEVDIWSIGVNMYAMLTGCLPYTVEPFNITALHAKMLENKMNPIPEELTPDCRDLLLRLLTSNPRERIQMVEIFKHPWLNKGHELPFSPAPFPNHLTINDINEDVTEHMVHILHLKDTENEIKQEVLGNQASSTSAIYYLLCARLSRYNKAKPVQLRRRLKKFSQEKNHREDDDDIKSTVSCPVKPRISKSRQKSTKIRPISEMITDSRSDTKNRPPTTISTARRNSVPTTVLEVNVRDFRKYQKAKDEEGLGTVEKYGSLNVPFRKLEPIQPTSLPRSSFSQPHDLCHLGNEHDIHRGLFPYHKPAWNSQPASRNSSRASSRNSLLLCNNPSISPTDEEDLHFHPVNSSNYKTPKHTMDSGLHNDIHFPTIVSSVKGMSKVKQNDLQSQSGLYETHTELSAEAIEGEVLRVSSNLGVKMQSTDYRNTHTLTCQWKGLAFTVSISKLTRSSFCRIKFQLVSGDHDLFQNIIEKIVKQLKLLI